MLKKIGISTAVIVAALGLMQTSAFAAERNGARNDTTRNGYVQNDRNRQVRDQRGAYAGDNYGRSGYVGDGYVRDRDDQRAYDHDDYGAFRDQGRWGSRFEFRFGFDGDRR